MRTLSALTALLLRAGAFGQEAPGPVEEVVVVGEREGAAKTNRDCIEAESERERLVTVCAAARAPETGEPGLWLRRGESVDSASSRQCAAGEREVTLGELRDAYRRREMEKRRRGERDKTYKRSTFRDREMFPELWCQEKAAGELRARGKVLKARVVDGKPTWVRE